MITENISLLLQVLTLMGIVFAVYFYFRKPQEKSEINDAVFDVQFKSLGERIDMKFNALEKSLDIVKNNDLHELKGMFNAHIMNQTVNEREVAAKFSRLETLIDQLLKK